jgi:NADP-dependent 3-hydroxy acid dehydrogenase YdfG
MGPLYMTHAVLNHMIDARFGRIIYLGSAAAVARSK